MTLDQTIVAARECRPLTPRQLWLWVHRFTGVRIATRSICEGHSAPFTLFADQVLHRPSLALWHGPRGSGKSFLSAIDTHVSSRFNSRFDTCILGGSLSQSRQIYGALTEVVRDGSGSLGGDGASLERIAKEEAQYVNGSNVKILAASSKRVHGPHVVSLKLDEVDEIDSDIREASIGMVMAKGDYPPSILMTSTWHKAGGPMGDLMERGRDGEFPAHTYCVFEVLERCPESRSGPHLEKCPECPIVEWCHQDRDHDPCGLPKAKRSDGHYTIDTLIQKVKLASKRVFCSDYLCLGPQVQGVWFTEFSAANVTIEAEYDPALPVFVSVDSGVWCGAVFFQVRAVDGGFHHVNVFGEYLRFEGGSELHAIEVLEEFERRCSGARRRVSTDSAGGARNPIGITVYAEYERAGLRGEKGLEYWPKYPGSVLDGLGLVESLVKSADGTVWLTIHPRCRKTVEALQSYARDKVSGQWVDYPKDPQHPHEEMVDALRGGLKLVFPESRRPRPKQTLVHARRVF